MDLVNWNPFAELDGIFGRSGGLSGLPREGRFDWRPAADIIESDAEYLIKADLPEVRREDIDVSVNNGVITLSGERKYETRDDSEKARRVEKFYGSFTRSFTLPENVDPDAIMAEQKDGVLTIHLPKSKKTESRAKSITVN